MWCMRALFISNIFWTFILSDAYKLQWNLSLPTPRFTYIPVYVRRFLENVALVNIQNFVYVRSSENFELHQVKSPARGYEFSTWARIF